MRWCLCFLVGALIDLVGAYDTWHAIDAASVICPDRSDTSGTANVNLAAGKAATCVGGVNSGFFTCDGAAVTDGKKACIDALNSPMTSRYDCRMTAAIELDLGSPVTFDEVVLYQDTCNQASFCGHKVEVKLDNGTWQVVFQGSTSDYSVLATASGASMRFDTQVAQHLRVHSSRNNINMYVYFIEVEVYFSRSLPPPPPFTVAIQATSQLDMDSPYILSFIRETKEETTIEYELKSRSGAMIKAERVTLVATGNPPPSSCRCTGDRLLGSRDIDIYGSEYGSSCGKWDEAKCDVFWPNQTLGSWCCMNWCYADASCPDAYMSSLIPNGYYSYSACQAENQGLPDCMWKPPDLCECRNVLDIMDERMKDLFPPDYGSKCMAWDSLSCEANYRPDQIDTWCCKSWCYVDSRCPHAIPSLNPGMEDKLFWTAQKCTQDAAFISQCPYQKLADNSDANFEKCKCLGTPINQAYSLSGMDTTYGQVCAPHDKDYCETWYPSTKTDMWCCASWCYVSSDCPDAQPSTLSPGQYWSSFTCDWDPQAVANCKYSNACKCSQNNTGVDTRIFGSEYGKTCSAWDKTDCAGWWNNTASWSNTSRNDWCCQEWCYVNDSCPLVDEASLLSNLKYSYEVCAVATEVYNEVSNTCQAPASCECMGTISSPTAYGMSCGLHEAAMSSGCTRGISCCLPWCYVDAACNNSVPHPGHPGKFISYETCASSRDISVLVNCPHSKSCQCTGNNSGLDSRFGTDYGKACLPHDAVNCYKWWGPGSGSGFWNTTPGGNNDWCCDPWCYVAADCPIADFGEGGLHYSYSPCTASTDVFDEADKQCKAGSARRLEVVEEPIEEGEEVEDEESSGCEEFFLLDGRSPAELPDTWGDAREATTAMCMDEGFGHEECSQAVEIAFEGFPQGGVPWRASSHEAEKTLCARLLLLGAAAEASESALASLRQAERPEGESQAQPPLEMAARVQEALRHRAGRGEGDSDEDLEASAMDDALSEKVTTWAASGAGGLAVAQPMRRLKSGGSSSSWGSRRSPTPSPTPPPVPVARRRTPQRPVGIATRRRGVPPGADPVDEDPPGIARRRVTSFSSHRRRHKDIDGKSRITPAGSRYGYTSRSHLSSNFGGQVPMHAPYGYSAANVYPRNKRSSVAMYGAAVGGGAAVGAAMGVGAYYLYHQQEYGRGVIGWRRRRVASPSWCMASPGSGVDMMECSDCFDKFGFCESANDCFSSSGTGCGMTMSKDYGKDDLMESGFIPSKYDFPLTLTISKIEGPGIKKEAICPITDPAFASLDASRITGFSLWGFVTLARMEELDAAPPPTSFCVRNTNYRCKAGAIVGEQGMSACYGEDEVCVYEDYENLCFCKPGYCLDTSSQNGLCLSRTAASAAVGRMRQVFLLLPLAAIRAACFFAQGFRLIS
mmetsp:Transcript_13168/g.37894  ORF Transcript_13168/g.37894 Transcript_13168/m.37894 type:complete len:1411 (-) Transcript_13168:126-4358(-)